MDKDKIQKDIEEIKKARDKGKLPKITGTDIQNLTKALDDYLQQWLIDSIDKYCSETGEKLDISWDKVKGYLTLNDLKQEEEFHKLLKSIIEEDRKSRAEQEEKTRTTSHRPTKYSQSVTKLTEDIPQLDFSGERTEEEFRISKRKAKIKTVTLITDNTYLQGKGVLHFDNTVLNAVISFIEEGETQFTLEQITNFVYYGDNTASKAGKKQMNDVRNSLRKQMFFPVTVDYTQHLQMNNTPIGKLGGSGKITDQRLPLKEFELTNRNGNVVICYALKEKDLPPEYIYCKDVDQMSTVPANLLDTPQDLHLKPEDVVWRDYFIRNIDTMKKVKKFSRTMTVDKILEKCGITFKTKKPRDEKSKLLNRFEILLNDFKRKKFIKGFSVKRGKRNVIEGYEIEL